MEEFNKGIKELIKLMKENPDLKVVIGCDATNMEIETDYFEMQIDCCYVDHRAIYYGVIFYDENELIDEIIDIDGIGEESAAEKAHKLMENVIIIQAKGFPV